MFKKFSMLTLILLFTSSQTLWSIDYQEECSGINANTHQDEWSFCVKAVTASNYDIDCVECLMAQQEEESNPWVEALGIVAGPLAYFGSAYVGAKYAYKSQQAWADAYESGYESCNSQFNSALDYNVSSGSTSYTADELSTLMSSCNGSSLGTYSGYSGLLGTGYGSYGNPYLSAGYSSNFMSGMLGNYSSSGLGLTGSSLFGSSSYGLGSSYGLSSGLGLSGSLGLSGTLGLGSSLGIGTGYGYGNTGYGYGYSPYSGLGGSVNLGIGSTGGWGYANSYPNATGYYGLPSYALGGTGITGANLGLGAGTSAYSLYGNGASSWYPSGSYYGNTGGLYSNQYWSGASSQLAQSSLASQLNGSSSLTSQYASSALYSNYLQSSNAYSSLGNYYGSSGYYGSTPYSIGNLSANLGISGYASFGL